MGNCAGMLPSEAGGRGSSGVQLGGGGPRALAQAGNGVSSAKAQAGGRANKLCLNKQAMEAWRLRQAIPPQQAGQGGSVPERATVQNVLH